MSTTIAPAALAAILGDGWRRPTGASSALAAALRACVVDGRIAVRTRIPSERALAEEVRVSRGTVSRAYDRLREDGYLASARGSGSWLTLPGDPAPMVGFDLAGTAPARATDLSIAALPAPEPLLSEAAAAAAQALGGQTATLGFHPAGLPALREAVAARFTERGVATRAEEILVTAGAQQALHVVISLLTGPGDRVLVDLPTYPLTLAAIRGARARPVAVPLTPRGWDAEAWAQALAVTAPRLGAVIPDFHNPTGLTMSAADRGALVEACACAGTLLLADETNSELRLDGPAMPAPLAAHDPGGVVVTVGSMSKSAWGGLRLGWIRAAPQLIRELTATRGTLDLGSPVLEQLVAVELLARWDEVLASRRALLRARRDVLLAALAEHTDWQARTPRGGLSAWVRLPLPIATRLAAAAARESILITPGPSFSVDGTLEHHLRLPFTLPEAQLTAAVVALSEIAGRLDARGLEPAAPLATAV